MRYLYSIIFLAVSYLSLIVIFDSYSHGMTIHHDRGGNVALYTIKKNQLNARGEHVQILGTCLSACTIYLGANRVCVGPVARLGFHLATNPAGTRLMMAQWPAGIRAWVRARGLTRNFVYLSGGELRRYVKGCK